MEHLQALCFWPRGKSERGVDKIPARGIGATSRRAHEAAGSASSCAGIGDPGRPERNEDVEATGRGAQEAPGSTENYAVMGNSGCPGANEDVAGKIKANGDNKRGR